MFSTFFRRAHGFTIAETATILAAASILSAAVAPAIQDYVVEARMIKAREDTHTLASAFGRFVGDVAAQSTRSGGWATYELLVGAGEVPTAGSGGDGTWTAAGGTSQVGLLADQLVANAPAYTAQHPSMVNWIRGWHGPYVEAGVGPDPWGHRYAINVKWHNTGEAAVFVLSAGSNGAVETPFRTATAIPGGDDVIGLVAGAN